MEELKEVFVKHLWNSVKDRVNASVFCDIDKDDVLIIRIRKNDVFYEKKVKDITSNIVYGLVNSNELAKEITKEWKDEVLKVVLQDYIK